MSLININGFKVGGDKVYIIADVGSNHMQNIQIAKDSIDAAAEAGADAVKFQSIQLNELYLNPDKDTIKLIRQLEFPEEWHVILKEYADKKGITFFSSPTYLKAVDLLESVNVPVYKLASAQVGVFPQIVEKVASLNKPTIFSTGIAAMDDIKQVVSIFQKYKNNQYMLLHCNSIYPTPPDKVNLSLIQKYTSLFANPVGFSDHTIGTHISCAAVTLGAKIIEKHFTLNRDFNSPDSNSFACNPSELELLVKQIRDIEKSLIKKSDRTEIEIEEKSFKDSIEYKIVASCLINEGEEIQYTHIKYLRNTYGINCKSIHDVVGKRAKRKINENELIVYEELY